MAKKKEEKVKRIWGEKTATPMVRTSYSYITKPDSGREFSDDKFKFTAMLEKERKDELKPLKQAILAVAKEAFGKDTKLKDLELPFKDGDKKDAENLAGHIVFNLKTKNKPGVIVGKNKTKFSSLSEEEQQDIALDNAGYHVIANVTPSSYKRTKTVEKPDGTDVTKTVQGVTLALNSIWYIKDDDRFGGAGNAESDFAEVDVDEDAFDDELGDDEDTGSDEETAFDEDDDDLL